MVSEKEEGNNRATILGIGTAVPPNCVYQTQFPDLYFSLTNTQHNTLLKQKLQRICEKSAIKKRYFHWNEEILKANPNMCKYGAPSLDARLKMMAEEVPKLGKEAALKAIQDWGQPISTITHLIFTTYSSNSMPGPDFHLSNLLGLRPSVGKYMLFQLGCHAAATALRLAKDVAENNSGARVLVVCVDSTTIGFHAPPDEHVDMLVGPAIFSDGAAAVVVGADPDAAVERGLFQIVSAGQTVVPDTEDDGVHASIKEMGLVYHLSRNIPKHIGRNIEKCLAGAECDYNSLFYVIHPGGRAILDEIEKNLGLGEAKLESSRQVLSEYGNMGGPTVVFVLDEMRNKSIRQGKSTTGHGFDCGVLMAFGPGLTIETLILKSVPIV
ncbi:chalcone synthase-like [Momordica charantia]|uniref:Chalcone synthase-like n=1 Tax=Momordica charantia TaxID=3673 RepID=A0A6J1CK67_MOMCH|nr:chalcone synthase-like [Momordica charantia]